MAASTAGNASFTAAFSVDQTPEEASRKSQAPSA